MALSHDPSQHAEVWRTPDFLYCPTELPRCFPESQPHELICSGAGSPWKDCQLHSK